MHRLARRLFAAIALPLAALFAAASASAEPPALEARGFLRSGPTIDLTIHRGVLWSIGDGRLVAADISTPATPREIGSLGGLSGVRQIVCAGDHAYVAARDEGLYVVNIADPARPRLVYHYDTLEKATGIAVAPPVLAVANRYHGVELLDISEPANPRYLSTVLGTKEIQSVDIEGGLLYAGAWADREALVVDISNPRRPRRAGSARLDGYGDGVRARAGLCLAATGHHSAAYQQPHYAAPAPSSRGYGEGHGLEVFAVSGGGELTRLGGVKFPAYYQGYPDTWQVETSGDLALVADMHNGVFAVDVSDATRPIVVGRALLPEGGKQPGLAEPAAAVAPGNGVIYVAGYDKGVHVFALPASRIDAGPRPPGPAIPAATPEPLVRRDADGLRYRPDGQVRAALSLGGDVVALAAGNGGLHLVSLAPEFRVLATRPTRGIAMDVAERDGLLYVAESTAGVSVWRWDRDGALQEIGRHAPAGISAQQVVAPAGSRFLLLQNGARLFEIIDAADPSLMRLVLSDRGPGLFYGKWISTRLAPSGLAAVAWNMGGPVWYNLALATPARVSDPQAVVGNIPGSGAWMLEDGSLLFLHGNGYSLLDPAATPRLGAPMAKLDPPDPINGAPSARGNVLFTTSGAWRIVRAIDISDRRRPRLIEKWETRGNPFQIAFAGGKALVPEGHEGLVVIDAPYLASQSPPAPAPTPPSPAPGIGVTDLPDNLSALLAPLEPGASRCSDNFVFTIVPKSLQGLPSVRIRRGDKQAPGAAYSFTIDRPAWVYLIAMDNGVYSPGPDWERTGLQSQWRLGPDQLFTDTIYRRRFEAGRVEIPAHTGGAANKGVPHVAVVASAP